MAEDQIEKLRQEQEKLINQLKSSSTARAGKGDPSFADIAANKRLLDTQDAIRRARNKELQDKWYGDMDDFPQAEGAEGGWISRTFDYLMRPVYGVVGAVDYATGSSPEKNLGDAITENARDTKRLFGDVLEDAGAPKVVSAPLGLALDIAFDPLNWATFGSAALVPRVGMGAVRGATRGGLRKGLEAAGAGFKSKAYGAAATTGRVGAGLINTPGNLARLTQGGLGKVLKKDVKFVPEGKWQPKAVEELSEKAAKEADKYGELVGKTVIDRITNPSMPGLLASRYQRKLGDQLRAFGDKVPVARRFFDAWHYDPAEWHRLARIKDALTQLSGGGDDMTAALRAYNRHVEEGVSYSKAFAEEAEGLAKLRRTAAADPKIPDEDAIDTIFKQIDEAGDLTKRSSKELDDLVAEISEDSLSKIQQRVIDQADIVNNPDKFISEDHVENFIRIASNASESSITLDDLKKVVKMSKGETGIKWLDRARVRMTDAKHEIKFGKSSIKIGKRVEQLLDGIQGYISLFKRAKVGGSPTAWTNAVVGNLVMAKMAGINIMDPTFMRNVKESAKLLSGKGKVKALFLSEMMANKEALKTMITMPTTLKSTTGLTKDLINRKFILSRLKSFNRDAGNYSDAIDIQAAGKAVGHALTETEQELRRIIKKRQGKSTKEMVEEEIRQVEKNIRKAPREQDLARAEGRAIDEDAIATSMVGGEFFDSEIVNEILALWKERSKLPGPRGYAYKMLDTAFSGMTDAYETIDQSYKLGTFFYTTGKGVTESELTVIARNIVLPEKDIIKVGSRYKLSGNKALELSNEIYLNYKAMPAAIKALRSIPLIGFPFASFTYGMSLKTLKTIKNNPALFNKVNYALNEFEGSKSPVEKAVMSDPRYSYFDAPGMFRVPGTGGVPTSGGPDKFFREYGLYVNVAQMIPYLTLNMLTPTNRRYQDKYSDRIVNAIDTLPFFKGPVGGTIMDYFIIPTIARESRPLGQFGQPLYPTDASTYEKAQRMVYQGIIDPVVPGVIALASKPLSYVLPEEAIDYMPTYSLRKGIRAWRGESPIGKVTPEDRDSRGKRATYGVFGVPIQTPINFDYLPEDIKKRIRRDSQ